MINRDGNPQCDWCGDPVPRRLVRRGGTASCSPECSESTRRDWTRRHQRKMYETNPVWRERKLEMRRAWGRRKQSEARA